MAKTPPMSEHSAPPARSGGPAGDSAQSTRLDMSGFTALVVDDDQAFGTNLAAALEDEGLRVILRHDPAQGLEAAREQPLELAFLDINMPTMNGLDLAGLIMEARPGTRVVLISGRGTFEHMVQALKIGAYDFLSKPMRPGDLQMCLSRFCQRRALHQRIQAAERRHTALLQNIPLLVFRLRRDQSVQFINDTCQTMLGFPPPLVEAEPQWFAARIHPDDRQRVMAMLAKAPDKNAPMTMECRMEHAKGYSVHGILKTIPAPAGAVEDAEGLLDCIFMDISERVVGENIMVQDEKMKTLGAVTAQVSHEIRNPLMAIAGFARRLSTRMPDNPETDIILRESKRLEHLLRRIQGYLDPVEPDYSPTDVNDVARNVLARNQSELEVRGVTARADLDPELPRADTDPDLLGKIFSIILTDAAKALDKGGRLAMKTFLGGGKVNVRFRYSFADLKYIESERIYLPFEEGGFGLPLCHRLVKKMGGLLTLAREADQAVITVALPYTPA